MRYILSIIFLIYSSLVFAQYNVDIKIDINEYSKGDIINLFSPQKSFLNFDTISENQNSVELKEINNSESEISLSFNNSSYTMYIENNDEFTLHFYNLNESPLIDGKNRAKAQILSDLQVKYPKIISSDSIEPIYKGVDAYESLLYSDMKQQIDFVNNHKKFKEISPNTKSYLYNLIKYNYLNKLLAFSIKKEHPKSIKSLPTIMLNLIKPEIINKKNVLFIENYRQFIDKYITYIVFKENIFEPITEKSELINNILKQAHSLLNGNIKTYYISKNLTKYHSFITKETFENYYKLISSDETFDNYKSLLDSKLQANIFLEQKKNVKKEIATKPIIKENSNSKKLSFIDTNGKKVRLSNFKGKIIYIDIWASWCGPCRKQFPYAKDLQDKFTKKEKNKIVFLYISIDANETAWKKAIEKIEIHGINVLSPGGWNSDVTKHFQIRSIPRYLLLDKNGKVVDANAKRPSQIDEIYKEIIELL